MTKEAFRKLIKASPTTIAAMGRGEGISPKVLERICIAFNCQPGDIMEYIQQPNETDSEISAPDIDDDDFIPEFMREDYDPPKKEPAPEPKPENPPKRRPTIDDDDYIPPFMLGEDE